jgi:hypothetical protein
LAILVIRILAGHIIGDFILQTDLIAKRKYNDLRYLFIHIALIFTAMMICTVGYHSWRLVLALAIISLLHYFDRFKKDKPDNIWWFLGDQAFHLISIVVIPAMFGIWSFTRLSEVLGTVYYDSRIWVYLLGYLTGVWGGRIIIGKILESFKRPDYEQSPLSPLADKIGIVERLIVITLALFNQYTAIGIIFAIKGVARKSYAERNDFQGEIYFLGTGLSFFLAIVTAVLIKWLLVIAV